MREWQHVPLRSVAAIERDGIDPRDAAPGTTYVGLEHIDGDGIFLEPPLASVAQLASTKFRFTSRHVLYGKLRPYLRKIACPEFDGICSTDIVPIKPSASLDRRFLFHYLRLPQMVDYANSKTAGINLPRLSPSVLAEFAIPLPPLPEQRRIAGVLDRAEALRSRRRAALAQLDTLAQAIFLEMFGEAEAEGWPVSTIADVAQQEKGSIRTGPFGSQLLHSEFVDEGVAVLGIDNAVANEFRWGERRFITESKYRGLTRYTVRPGDVLITIMGTCGRCAVVPNSIPLAINTKHLCCITLDQEKCLPVFLHAYFLQHPIARRHLEQTAKGAIMSGLNMGLIQAMPIRLPPMPLQEQFIRRIESVERLKASHRSSLTQLDELFASLQHRAFRGEL